MDAVQAQKHIDSLKPAIKLGEKELKYLKPLKVDYASVKSMPKYKQDKIRQAIKWIKKEYNPPFIDLVMSQLDGYPIDEKTSQALFNRKIKIFGSAKFSDWDFIVPGVEGWQRTVSLSPFLKIDLFSNHHNDVKTLRVYSKKKK